MSSNDNNTSVSGGIGFSSLLFLVFLVLKLTGVIDWAWWIVFLPLIVPAVILITVFAVVMLFLVFSGKKIKKNAADPKKD